MEVFNIEFKYKNTMDEYLNGYKLIMKFKKIYFIIFNVLPKTLGTLIIMAIVYSFKILFKEINLGVFSIKLCLCILVLSFISYELFTIEKDFLNRIQKKLKTKYGEFKELTCKVEDHRFLYEQGNNKTEVLFDQIYKVVEDNNSIYIFGEKYLILLIIPTSVFKNSEEKNKFLIKMEGLNT